MEPQLTEFLRSRLAVALELAPPELQRLVVVLKPLKPAVAPGRVLVLRLGLVVNHVEVLKLVVALELVALGLLVTQGLAVLPELAVALDPAVIPVVVVGLSPEPNGSPATQLNTPMSRSSSYKSVSCPPQASALRSPLLMLQLCGL